MQSRRRIFFSIVFIVSVAVVLHYAGVLAPFELGVRSLVGPSAGFLHSAAETVRIPDSVAVREQAMSAELALRARTELLTEENDALRSMLNFAEKTAYSFVGAHVVGRSSDPVGTSLVVNRGERDGVVLGAPVTVGAGAIVGKVISVESGNAIVRLINDPGSSIAATIINRQKSIGLVEGGFGVSVRMRFIPQNESVNQGDIVVTSGLEQSVPAGLLIGTVEVVERQAHEPFQEAVLKPAANLSRVSAVLILLNCDPYAGPC